MAEPELNLRGLRILPGRIERAAQEALVADLRDVVRAAPFVAPETRFGRKMSVRMTSAGRYGWVSDRSGYRYARRHPEGMDWPAIPDRVLALWRDLVSDARDPDCCLVNYYGEGARMGLHQDRDEADFTWPVLSVSLGDEGLLRVGNATRGGRTESIWLRSGDVVVMGGDARLVHHGVDRIKFRSSTLLPQGGRINLTLRVVD
ncbi:alpha-ketoglutarate-dependent dioxygenase AlkB [Roseovarius spongiae]|uniref:Alpha-ketoglutarate-dependent dioxygenase AlkB n=1 Tax=Roseovarius spongiae TaxID=2320272 RepID=A0A3A8AS77_9RHOB|nr:alpha-ketoglutarate-dependent dioxygenase AlkB [Roseovarius spongiae]RKF13992.1 alpha-ketoglutarate-dependent dioxygenase AlkB [Roseovarius spongiae]